MINGTQIKSNDVQGLMNLSLDMEKCQITLSQLGYMSDINNRENLRKIVRRLPMHIRAKWADQASRLIDQGSEPAFKDLLAFIQQRAVVANTMYGQDLVHKFKPGNSQQKVSGHQRSTRGKCVTLSTTTADNHVRSSRRNDPGDGHYRSISHVACVFCGERHRLINCEKFKGLDLNARIDVVRKNRMCNDCLNFKHYAKFCKKSSCCEVNGCRQKHHTL